MFRRVMIAMALLAVPTMAFAQGGGQGRGQGRGGPALSPLAIVLEHKADLKLAAEQVTKVEAMEKELTEKRLTLTSEEVKQQGLEVVETYDGQFSQPEQGVDRYWQLDDSSAEAAWEAFRPHPVQVSPRQSYDIGVLGVNAIAAEDGTVFFVQHLFNISEILQRASQVVLVIGVERVVRDSPEISDEFRIELSTDSSTGMDAVTVVLEINEGVEVSDAIKSDLITRLRQELFVTPAIRFEPYGSLERTMFKAKRILDLR